MTLSPRSVAMEPAAAAPDAPAGPAVARPAPDRPPAALPDPGPGAAATPSDPRDRTVLTVLIVAMLVLYGLLQNPYWVPSGDGEVYVTIARNLARDGTYTFNGQPVAMVPPGWPLVMAAVMSLTPYFLPLKLLAMACMIGALVCGYRIARRYVSPKRAALVILTTAILSHVYQGTYWLISESLFCLVSAAAILVAFQIREGRAQWWRIALLAVLCGSAITVRWAGFPGFVMVASVLHQGRFWPRLDRRFVALLIAAACATGVFFGLRVALEVTPEQAAATRAFGGAGEDPDSAAPDVAAPPVVQQPTTQPDNRITKSYSLVLGTEVTNYRDRFVGWGRWLSFLYWQPFRAAAGSAAIEAWANGLGWALLGLLAVPLVAGLRRLDWLWAGLMTYCLALGLNWPFPTARYYVPVAFLLTLGIYRAACLMSGWFAAPAWRGTIGVLRWTFFGSVLACNAALWSVEATVARADDFYAAYEAGMHAKLLAASRYLNDVGAEDGRIAINPRYVNLNRPRISHFGLRVTNLLTGKAVVSLPRRYQGGAPGAVLGRWLSRNGIDYYIHQAAVSPWRVWHFRVAWWQRVRTGEAPVDPNSGWQLYEVGPRGEMTRIDLEPSRNWPTRVPGLERDDGAAAAAVVGAPAAAPRRPGEPERERGGQGTR